MLSYTIKPKNAIVAKIPYEDEGYRTRMKDNAQRMKDEKSNLGLTEKKTPYTKNSPYEFKLLVRGSKDASNTVIVLKVEETGEIFGSYNPLEIKNNINWKWYSSQDTPKFQFGNELNLRGNLKTGTNSICSTEYYEKQIRSNTSVFSVEEFEVFKVSPKK
ncbi:hypothetical protein Glove_37g114 [Diversispora epigaea]|uniref:TLDc domain-containing protein n=1 Tax=Diversispora epigaea TaxID=1348612 RepID=A0A397JMX0_9GLOM|nr:hypothetical protein Glove_37g114 [Diversispora epigaea]